jgi:hypothetical protein
MEVLTGRFPDLPGGGEVPLSCSRSDGQLTVRSNSGGDPLRPPSGVLRTAAEVGTWDRSRQARSRVSGGKSLLAGGVFDTGPRLIEASP